MSRLYFAYGSNLDPAEMRERCPSAKLIGKGVLHNHSLAFSAPAHGLGGAADIVVDLHEQVWGLLYEVSDEDFLRLDALEGHPTDYRRKFVTVINEQLDCVLVETYEVVNKSEQHISPSADYLEKLERAALEFAFPDTYIAKLGTIETHEDNA